jgi:hypothetical protein
MIMNTITIMTTSIIPNTTTRMIMEVMVMKATIITATITTICRMPVSGGSGGR